MPDLDPTWVLCLSAFCLTAWIPGMLADWIIYANLDKEI